MSGADSSLRAVDPFSSSPSSNLLSWWPPCSPPKTPVLLLPSRPASTCPAESCPPLERPTSIDIDRVPISELIDFWPQHNTPVSSIRDPSHSPLPSISHLPIQQYPLDSTIWYQSDLSRQWEEEDVNGYPLQFPERELPTSAIAFPSDPTPPWSTTGQRRRRRLLSRFVRSSDQRLGLSSVGEFAFSDFDDDVDDDDDEKEHQRRELSTRSLLPSVPVTAAVVAVAATAAVATRERWQDPDVPLPYTAIFDVHPIKTRRDDLRVPPSAVWELFRLSRCRRFIRCEECRQWREWQDTHSSRQQCKRHIERLHRDNMPAVPRDAHSAKRHTRPSSPRATTRVVDSAQTIDEVPSQMSEFEFHRSDAYALLRLRGLSGG